MDRAEPTIAVADETEEEEEAMTTLGAYSAAVHPVSDAAEEILLLWSLHQPTFHRQNSFVRQSSTTLRLDACGRHLTILQTPSSMSSPGVTGAVMWDSGVVLAKFLEHAVDSRILSLNGKKALELGSGCGLVGCVAALLGAHVVLTDLPDRMRLLKKNVEGNVAGWSARGSAAVEELTWGDDLDSELAEMEFDFVVGSDVIYSEGAVVDLLCTLRQLSRSGATTIFLAGELRNDEVLHCFLEAALEEFLVGRIDQMQWHPEYRSERVAIFVLVKKVVAPESVIR